MTNARRARRDEADEASTYALEVIDALGGFARLAKRSPTLDGAVPLRVAQACVPLLEGNAFGFQIELTQAIVVRRRLGRTTVAIDAAHRDAVARAQRAALPRLAAEGLLAPNGPWHRALAEHVVWFERPHVRVWTGLLVRAPRGVWLRVSNAANRRNRLVDVRDAYIDDDDRWVPLVVDMIVRPDDETKIQGEIACVAPLAPGARFECVDLADAPALGRAHAAFYDEAYFATKKDEPTRKYRRLVAREAAPGDAEISPVTTVARVGPSDYDVSHAAGFLHADATKLRAASRDLRTIEQVVYKNDVAFTVRFDGHTLAIDHDAKALASAARDVERRWAAVYGAASVVRDRRALWYLTKYFTPHPPGEPHFFVKPWTFTETAPGWSCLLEGVQRDEYDVMRGVVSTDTFHATPAVFWMHRIGERVRVPAGAPLLRVVPVPRWLTRAKVRNVAWTIDWSTST